MTGRPRELWIYMKYSFYLTTDIFSLYNHSIPAHIRFNRTWFLIIFPQHIHPFPFQYFIRWTMCKAISNKSTQRNGCWILFEWERTNPLLNLWKSNKNRVCFYDPTKTKHTIATNRTILFCIVSYVSCPSRSRRGPFVAVELRHYMEWWWWNWK